MVNQTIKFTVGGPVQAKFGTYLPRPADEELLSACQAGKFAYVLACRQIGKSSLMFATSAKLGQVGIRTALIDLNSIGQNVEADSWYFSLIDELARKLKLSVDIQAWWEERPRLSTLNQRFLQFLRQVVLEEISGPVVIFVDEIDMTLGLGFTDDFFAAVRAVHNDRAQVPAYHRLTFVLLGVATPDELIKDHSRTPFNIGQPITLNDFSEEECEPFCLTIEAKYPHKDYHYFDQIYEWTGGHPYLTQKLCDALLKADALELETNHAASIDSLIRKLFLRAEARSEDNIQFVQTRITGDPYAQDMLKIYKRILEGKEPVPDDEQSPPINRLKLYGLIVARNSHLEVRNKLYQHAFTLSWADEMLASIRLGLPSRYKILQEIGQGGFSTVYLAQLQLPDQTQTVALKVLRSADGNDTTPFKRFKQEARAVAKLEQPNIIRIFETSADEEPSFIAMEYISGGTLRDRLKTGPLPRREAIDIVRQIGAALTYAHNQGIIHRDVNPNNILLDTRYDPARPRPVLTDFGLIKLLSPDNHTQIASTATIIGTFGYMAPEQWKQETPTPATDVYALAITFFEMLSGSRPFQAVSPFQLMDQHTNEPLPHLSSVAPAIGSFFDDVLLQATAKEPVNRFNHVADFIEALEAANQRAEEVERAAQEDQAARMIEAVQGYIQNARYHPDRALAMIEAALEVYPEYMNALRLRGKIRLQQGQLEEALADYRQAYEQERNSSSAISLEYIETLYHIAETLWQRQQFPEAVKHYQLIHQILPEMDEQILSIRDVGQKARLHMVEYHHHEANIAYASGHPEYIDEAIAILEKKIEELKALEAKGEIEDLRGKLKRLQMAKYENIINAAQTAIGTTNSRDSHSRFVGEDIFQHFSTLVEAYQALSELEPENKRWSENRHKKLKEWAESRCLFASRALSKLEPDYEAALRHYKAVVDLEQTKYPGLTQLLNLNLHERIADLQVKADHDGKYNEILRLIEEKEYLKALERLDQEFIQTSHYEHREVARWLWGLVYAKQHEWNFPPEWESLSGFKTLSQRLVESEQGRIRQLRDKLELWSQDKILGTIGQEHKQLGIYEEQVKDLEISLDKAEAQSIDEEKDFTVCRRELAEVWKQIQTQRDAFFKINVKDTAQEVEGWLHKLEDIEKLMQTSDPLKNIPKFLDKIDAERPVIEKDFTFEALQALMVTNSEIGQTIDKVKVRMREQLFKILIKDISWRDEALALSRKDTSKYQDETQKAQAELSKNRSELAAMQAEMARLQETKRRGEIFKFTIPLALGVAIIAGTALANQFPDLSQVSRITFGLLIIYFLYYVWVYYLPTSRDR